MKETGIIMSGNHPQLIIDGLKTQTRRTWGLEKINELPDLWEKPFYDPEMGAWGFWQIHTGDVIYLKCPYGQVGDRLWVRETWRAGIDDDNSRYKVVYKAGGFQWGLGEKVFHRFAHYEAKWQPSIFMPRWASRITPEITGLRAERVQEITGKDIWAEGIERRPLTDITYVGDAVLFARKDFQQLWDSLNAKRGYSFDFNPWVWPIEFNAVGIRSK